MKNKKKFGKKINKIFANILLLTMLFNTFSFKVFAQENELFLKHDTTNYLDFGKFNLNLKNTSIIDNTNGAYFYTDGGSGTGDLSLKYNNSFNVKVGRKTTSSGYVLLLSGWTYEDGGGSSSSLGWIQLSKNTKPNNTQNPVNQNTLLVNSDNQNDDNYGIWIDSDSIFHGKGKVDNDSTYVVFSGESAISPKPFDIDGDGLLNSEEEKIFLGKNNIGDIDGDGFTDGERDWDSDGDGFNDKLDPFPMDSNKNNCTLNIKPTPNFCKEVNGIQTLDDSVFKDADGNWIDTDNDGLSDFLEYQFGTDKEIIDTDGDGLSDFLEYQFGLDGLNSTDANGDNDNDGIINIDEILGQYLEINFLDTNGINQTFTGNILTDYLNPDTDGDGNNDGNEVTDGTNPNNPDTDGDNIIDGTDPYPLDGTNNGQDITNIGGKDYSDNDDDGLPLWWENKYTNGKNSDRSNPQSSDNVVIQNDLSNGDISVDATGIAFGLDSSLGDTDENLIYDTYEDFDNDGFSNIDEYKNGTNPNNWDTDGDHLSDFEDPEKNNPLDLNGDQDKDSLLNLEEIDGRNFDLEYKDTSCNVITEINKKVVTMYNNKDSDADGLFDNEEKQKGTNPLISDTDGDGYSDHFEILTGHNPLNACSSDINAVPIDKDFDGLLNNFEEKYSQCGAGTGVYAMTGSFQDGFSTEIFDCEVNKYKLIDIGDGDNPDSNNDGIYDKNEDFDNDGLTNFQELINGTNPNNWDTDGDGIPDNMDPNPNNAIDPLQDTDGDGISDKIEILGIKIEYSYKENINGTCTNSSFSGRIALNYEKIDSDSDGLNDKYEIQNILNPIEKDIDGDGFLDGEEISLGTNPKNGCIGSENIPVDNDNDGLTKTFEDKYTNGQNQLNKIFILEKITDGGNIIYKSIPKIGDDGNKEIYNLIDNINGENPDSDSDTVFDGNEDFDNDGFSNKTEQINGTNPNNRDTDGDGIPDNIDVKPNNSGSIITATGNIITEFSNLDINGTDTDGDGLSDVFEDFFPGVFDKNNSDGNLGELFGNNGKLDGFEDQDNDGLINYFEMIYGTDPTNPDTDGDGVYDGIEITAKKLGDLNGNPLDSQKKPYDYDKDGLSDVYEEKYFNILDIKIKNWTGSTFNDQDNTKTDLLNNFEEQKKGTDPENNDSDGDLGTWKKDNIDIFPNIKTDSGFIIDLDKIDSDFDGISDLKEVEFGTDPLNPDTNGNGIIDGIEKIILDETSNPLDLEDSDGDLIPNYLESKTYSKSIKFQKNEELGNSFEMNSGSGNTYSNILIDSFADADGDGISNINELLNGTNPYDETEFNTGSIKIPNLDLKNYILPINGDFDKDGIKNIDEYKNGTDPRIQNGTGTYNFEIDSDNDGLSDGVEDVIGSDKNDWDTDNDGVSDSVDANPVNGNLQGDYNLYLDSDNDGLSDAYEIAMKKYWGGYGIFDENNKNLPAEGWDTDGDFLADIFEEFNHNNGSGFTILNKNDESTYDGGTFPVGNGKLLDKYFDTDGDNLSNLDELLKGTNPYSMDTDGDGINDDVDLNPIVFGNGVDTDGDGISDFTEIHGFTGTVLILDNGLEFSKTDLKFFTNSLKFDSDGDGLSDGYEKYHLLNPLLKDTDNDGWEDGIETNISFINSEKGNPNDKSIFPTDSDGDGLSDEWENYYTDPNDLTKFTKDGDFDNDGFSDFKEMQIGSDPTINNFVLRIEGDINASDTCDSIWSNSGKIITVVSPINLNNLDKNNSGFFTYENAPIKYSGINVTLGEITLANDILFKPSNSGEWVNNNQNKSSLNGSLVSTGSFIQNLNPLGPNKFKVIIKEDSYKPYIGFKTIDLISGKVPDNALDENGDEYKGFLLNQIDNEKDIYLGKSCVDATPPVCGIILSGGNHEQRYASWKETEGWISNDGTSSGKNLSMLSENFSDETKKFNLFKKIFSSLGFGEKKYFGNFDKSKEGYIPWTRGQGLAGYTSALTSNETIEYSGEYQDNLSGLKNSEIKMLNINDLNRGFTGNVLSDSLSGTSSIISGNKICTLDKTGNTASCDQNEYNNGNTGFSGKKAGIKIFDNARNYNYCTSAISKVDDSFPLVNIKSIIDDKNIDSLGDYASGIGSLGVNKGYTLSIELNDNKSYLNGEEEYNFLKNGVNTINGNSGFNPKDFGIGKLYYCGKGTNEEEKNNCITQILAKPGSTETNPDKKYLNEEELDNKYLYTLTGSTSSSVFAKGQGDFPLENGILFQKDAFFSNTGVTIKIGTGIVTIDDENGNFISSTGETITYNENDFNIEIGDGTGSTLQQVLFVENGSNSGAYISTKIGLYKIDNTGTWTPSGVKILSEDRMLGENENPIRFGNLAIKIYANTDTDIGPDGGDYFYLSFDFMDRAGNGLPLQYGFVLKENVYAKILGNIQSGQKTSTFDTNVQSFKMNESVVKNNIETIKSNLTNILTNAKDKNGSGILITNLDDLNEYKTSLGDEDIYVVKNGNFILGDSTGTGTLNLDPYNTGKAITIVTYGGNIIFNSKYINSSENTAFVSLVDPYLSQTTNLTLESQGNILINPELLIGKGQLIAEGSILSYANILGKIQTIFDLPSRRTIFKNQLVWDGTMLSNNTVGGYSLGTCPVSIYGIGNNCGFGNLPTVEEERKIQAISLTYDLHHLREYVFDNTPSEIISSSIGWNNTSDNSLNNPIDSNITQKMANFFSTGSTLSSKIPNFVGGQKGIDIINSIKTDETYSAPEKLKILTNSISELFQYPIIIKHSTPTKNMKIFK